MFFRQDAAEEENCGECEKGTTHADESPCEGNRSLGPAADISIQDDLHGQKFPKGDNTQDQDVVQSGDDDQGQDAAQDGDNAQGQGVVEGNNADEGKINCCTYCCKKRKKFQAN